MRPAPVAVGATLLIAAGLLAWPSDGPHVPELVFRARATGWLTALALVATLSLRLWPRRRPPLRRALGLAAAAALLVHVGWALRGGWVPAPMALLTEPALRSGATAALVLTLMAATSFPGVVRGLRLGHWRLLHRAVYAAVLLAVHHVALSPHARPAWVVGFAAVSVALLLARLGRRA